MRERERERGGGREREGGRERDIRRLSASIEAGKKYVGPRSTCTRSICRLPMDDRDMQARQSLIENKLRGRRTARVGRIKGSSYPSLAG